MSILSKISRAISAGALLLLTGCYPVVTESEMHARFDRLPKSNKFRMSLVHEKSDAKYDYYVAEDYLGLIERYKVRREDEGGT